MKRRITLTMDPAVARRAKRLAHARKTSVSALIEDFVRRAPLAGETNAGLAEPTIPFARRWAGKFRVAASDSSDARLTALKARYNLQTQ